MREALFTIFKAVAKETQVGNHPIYRRIIPIQFISLLTLDRKSLVLFSLLLSLLAACNATKQKNTLNSSQTTTLTVAAAASLTDAFTDIGKSFEAQHPNVDIKFNFAASGLLQKQIEQGAPVDIFASAADKQMNALEKQNLLVPQTRKTFAQNQLVLLIGKQSTWIKKLPDLKDNRLKLLAIGSPATVPAGIYAQTVLEKENLYNQLKQQKKLVFGENVRQVLTYLEQGNVDAAIVYATDAAIANQERIGLKIPLNAGLPIPYPIALIKQSQHPQQGKEFINFVVSSQGQQILQKYSFLLVSVGK